MGSDVVNVACGLTIVPLNSLWFVLEGAWSLRLLKKVLFFRKSFNPLPLSQALQRGALSIRRTSCEGVAHFHFLPEKKAVCAEVEGDREGQDRVFTGAKRGETVLCTEAPQIFTAALPGVWPLNVGFDI